MTIELVDSSSKEVDKEEEYLEECFFLMYHLHVQPSEAYNLAEEKRKWIIQRFIEQKQVEKQLMDNMRRNQVGTVPADFLKQLDKVKL